MKRLHALRHEFVEFIPADLENGVIYISIPYATATHLCACGCGSEVDTPFAPHGWSLIFDGRTISLSPSIGNWSFACSSHYWIQHGQITWAGSMSRERIDAARTRRRREIDADSERLINPARPTKVTGRRWLTRFWDRTTRLPDHV